MKESIGIIYTILSAITAKIGYTIHSSIFWSIIDFIFPMFAWAKWLFMEEVNMSVIRNSFQFFFA